MRKKSYEPELSLSPSPKLRNHSGDKIDRFRLSIIFREEVITHFIKVFRKIHGFTPPRSQSKFFADRFDMLIEYLVKEFFPEHALNWLKLPEFINSEEYGPFLTQRVMIATDYVDWVAANHFRSIDTSALTSNYWMAEYCKALSRRRLAENGPGTSWDKEQKMDNDIIASWEE